MMGLQWRQAPMLCDEQWRAHQCLSATRFYRSLWSAFDDCECGSLGVCWRGADFIARQLGRHSSITCKACKISRPATGAV